MTDRTTGRGGDAGAAVLAARGVSKVFGATVALRDVHFEARSGRVTALVGENGAGKSTLMRLLAGIERPTTGGIDLDGAATVLAGPGDAAARGIAIIHQELSLFPNLGVADNIFMARELRRRGVLDRAGQRRRARELLERLEEPIAPDTLVGELPLGQQQMVEIARALAQDVRVLIMDEPTSALSRTEVQVLFRVVRDLATAGVAVVFISHHLDEVLALADEVVVLRDGQVVARAPTATVDTGWVVERMIGRDPATLYQEHAGSPGDELLRIDRLTVAGPAVTGRRLLDEVSLSLRRGEILALYGLMGAGRTELLETVIGRRRPGGGSILLDGRRIDHLPISERIRLGLSIVPADRQADGLVQSMSLAENLTLASIGQDVHRLWLSRRRERDRARRMIQEVTVRADDLDLPVGALSGGNQQKVVLGRSLLTRPRVLLLDDPMRGVDIGAKAEISGLVNRLAQSGLGVLLASSEAAEVLGLADRILVLARGAVAAEFARGEADEETLLVASGAGATVEARP